MPKEYFDSNGIKSLRIYGYYHHGTAKETSDIDLLVDFDPAVRATYLDISQIQIDLTNALGLKVDLHTPS